MSGAENYTMLSEREFVRRCCSYFLIYTIIAVVSFVVGYTFYSLIGFDGTYIAVDSLKSGKIISVLVSLIYSQTQLAIQVMALFVSAFFLWNKIVAAMICAWRGVALGCLIKLFGMSAVSGVSKHSGSVLALYFATSVIFLVLTAVTIPYSEGIVHSKVTGRNKQTAALLIEFVKVYMVISGGAFVLGILTVII